MDDADRAQERIDAENAARMQSIYSSFNTPSLSECQECGEQIPLKRQLIGGITHCVDCQNYLEKVAKQRRR